MLRLHLLSNNPSRQGWCREGPRSREPLSQAECSKMKAGWAGTGVRSNANTTASGYQWARIKSLPEMRKVSTPPKRSPKEQKLTLR